MKNAGKKLLALVLSVTMLISTVPTQVFAYMAPKGDKLSVTDKDGKTITEDESWVTTFPYGTFAFEQSDLTVAEGGETGVLRLYRLGGTAGRAIAYLTYVPTIAVMADGSKACANAAGSEDVVISVEDPLPIAQYQPLGKLPEPLAAEKPALILQSAYTGTDAVEGDLKLTLDTQGERYQWQARSTGLWEPVEGAVKDSFVVGAEEFASYDFRCIYTVGGQQYGSASAKGEAYVREEEVLPVQPDGIELNPQATYSTLATDPSDPYLGYAFEVVFADGEWVKEIRFSSPEDTSAEAEKFGMVTIIDCQGGSLYDSANTLALRVQDNDVAQPCSLGFAVTAVEADKATGDAILTVRRTGGNQTMLTIDYVTKDGTALAGEDYMATSGTLTFYADADEQQIKIPMINDGIASEERRDFSVVLSDLKGDKDNLCTLTETVATVSLWNSGKAGSENLATLLMDGGAEDISGAVAEGASSVAPTDAEPVTGTQVVENSEPIAGVIGKDKKDDAGLLTYTYGAPITFSRDGLYIEMGDVPYWRDYYCFARAGEDYSTGYDMNSVGPMPFYNWEGGTEAYPGGTGKSQQFFSTNEEIRTLGVSDTLFPEHYDSIETYNEYSAEWLNHMLFGYEFTYGGTALMGSRGMGFPYRLVGEDCGAHMEPDGALSNKLVFNQHGFLRASWEMRDVIDSIILETKWFDANPSSEPAKAALRSGILHRRSLTNDLRLRILTANDADTCGKAAQLGEDFYSAIMPTVTLVPEMSGVTTGGKLYVGSQLHISLGKSGGAYTPGNSMDGPAVFLSNAKDNDPKKDIIAKGSGLDYDLAIEQNNIPLDGEFVINVVMNRKQNLNLDIKPSVPRGEDKININPDKIPETWTKFWSSSSNVITCGVAGQTKDGTRYGGIEEKTYAMGDLTGSNGVYAINNIENLQWVNFNRSEKDRILYNGRVYKANEQIWLQQSDLSLKDTNFLYYSEEYISAKSIMTPTLQRTSLYLDKNCNGQIDGHWDRDTNFFVLEKDANGRELDEFFYDLQRDVDYDESMFTPVAMEWDTSGKPTKYAQYFIKSVYQMTPRALVPPPGTNLAERAQVLPAFVSNVTDTGAYSRLTDQQKAYRYLISGKNRVGTDAYTRSADNHIMYGGEANLVSCIDIPLGGDTRPVTLLEDKVTFFWEPNYQGNLLYPFTDPDPISIAHSLAGDNIPVAEVKGYEGGKAVYKAADGAQKINGYLGSFTSNDTFALCVREQTKTTDEIALEKGITLPKTAEDGGLALLGAVIPSTIQIEGHPKPECVAIGRSGTFPNSAYLKETKSTGTMPDGNMDMGKSGNEYPEFNQDMGIEFPAGDVAATDFVTVIMDGYEVGFAIGIPLGGYNSNGDAGAGGVGTGGGGSGSTTGKDNAVSPQKTFESFAEDMGKLKNICKKMGKDGFGDAVKDTDDSYSAATNKTSKKEFSAHAFTVQFNLSLAFLFKYNPVDNGYYFSQFTVMPSLDLGFKYQQRFTLIPIAYMYIAMGFHVEMGTGVTSERQVVEFENPTVGTQHVVQTGFVGFETQKRAFNVTFKGKMLVECFTDSTCATELPNSAKGMVSSDGDDAVTLTITKGSSVMDIPKCYVRLIALTEVDLDNVTIIDRMETLSYSNGFQLAPDAFLEAGIGFGIEICKIEVFIKVSVGCSMTLGAYNTETKDYGPFQLNDFALGLGLGFRIVLLVFNYEMDLIRYDLNYDSSRDPDPGKPDGWVQSWAAVGGLYGGESGLTATDAQGNTYGVRVRLPGDTSQSQTIYSGEKPSGDVDPLAYNPNDETVPFQLSGYGSSGDAFKLADGLITGYDYKVITAGVNNYLIYTISRAGAAHAVDNTMLVLSKIKLTDKNGVDSYGLVNPLDETNTATPYIRLDTTNGKLDDGTGDLEFKAWTDATGVIHAAWVSYATKADVTTVVKERPASAVPTIGTVKMDEVNYKNTNFKPTAPTPVVTAPTPVVQGNYFLSEAEYTLLDVEAKKAYAEAGDNTPESKVYVAAAYTLYNGTGGALEAFTAAQDKFTADDALYQAYQADLTKYNGDRAIYDEWYAYFASLSDRNTQNQEIAARAAKNTVVKTASFDPKQTKTGFSAAEVVSGSAGSHVFLPIPADDKVTVYAKASHYTDMETNTLETNYKKYLKTIKYDVDAPGESNAKTIGAYRLTYQKGLWDAYGKGSSLCVSANGKKVTELALTEGQTLDSIEAAKIDGTYYVAYTTSEQQYMDNKGNTAAADVATDFVTIRRLFLRTFTVDAEGNVTWKNEGSAENKALLLRTLYDYDIAGKDGMYKGGKITTAYDDPYFANLQFLSGKLGDKLTGKDEEFETMLAADPQLESFLLFDMNGATYVIREESLKRITGSTKTGQIIPFFSPASLPSTGSPGGTKQQTTTGRAEVTIGADGAGNLSAVYVGTVPNTTNNALYLTKYDPLSGGWGVGTMLAMNYMQVHEDSIARGMYAEDAEKAFLGKLTGYTEGGMDQFKFTNLQIALGQTKTTDAAGFSLSADANGAVTVPGPPPLETSLLAAPPDTGLSAAGNGTKDTLLVITQGSMTYLEKKPVQAGKPETMLAPLSDEAAKVKHDGYVTDKDPRANRVPGIGVYAVSYGAGGQKIGESHLTFADYNFSSGEELKAGLSFFNTGDVAIRASAANKATVKLMLRTAGKGDSAIATWELTQNVLAGQKVILSGICNALTTDLPEGSIFYIAVSEDETYFLKDTFKADTLKPIKKGETTTYVGDLTVGSKAELGFAKMGTSIKPVAMDESGNTVLDVQFKVENRGNKQAPGVFVQFSYDNGEKDKAGNPIYVPLDIRKHTLKVSVQEKLEPLAIIENDLQNGIFYLYNAKDGNNIDATFGRTVSGTITVPSSLYKGSLTGSLNINVEIFSADDKVTDWEAALVTATHAEYDSNNNRFAAQVEHNSFFQSAAKVTIPMGTTMRLPLQVSTTKDTPPNIAVDEVPANGEEMHLGIRYYQPGTFANGKESGTLVLAPSSLGNGVLHLKDVNTNALYAVAYTVTEAGVGINIFNDTDIFAFKNADKSPYNPADLGKNDWQFEKGVPTWGEPVKDVTNPAPYLSDLAKGKVGTSFTYRTQAQSMQLYLNGEVKVTSTFPGFTAQTVSATGGNSCAAVSFGKNTNNVPHDVTITVTKAPGGYAHFDRIVEAFGSGIPKPSDDKNAPHLFWSRSFPDTATLETGKTPVQLTCYILDDGSLASVTVNGKEPEGITKTPENFWTFSLTVSANGPLSVAATDTAGNRTTRTTMVDWFNTTLSSQGSSAAPALSASLVKADGTTPLGDNVLARGEKAYVNAATDATGTTSASYYVRDPSGGLVETSLTAVAEGFPALANGYYVVTAKNAEPKEKEWATTVVYMDKVDIAVPVVALAKDDATIQSGGSSALTWSAQKEDKTSAATILEASINGFGLTFTPGQTWVGGSFPVTHAGDYTLKAKDTAGNSSDEAKFTLTDVPVRSTGRLVTVENASGGTGMGKVTVNMTGVVGGKYVPEESKPALNTYAGSYEWKLLANPPKPPKPPKQPEGIDLAEVLKTTGWLTVTTKVFDDKAPGEYTLYVRDANDPENAKTVLVTPVIVGDEAVTLTFEETTDKEPRSLNWAAKKGAHAGNAITEVTINGKKVNAADGMSLSGTMVHEYGGTYVLSVKSGTEAASMTQKVKDFPLTARSNDALLTIEKPWNDKMDGKVTVNLTSTIAGVGGNPDTTLKNLTGGMYLPAELNKPGGTYVGEYEWRLEPGTAGDAEWLKNQLAKTEGWTQNTEFPNLTAGNYIMILRDKLDDKNAKTALTIPISLSGEAVTFKATSGFASGATTPDGTIRVEATGGYLSQNVFQFAVRPIKSADPLGAIEDITDPLNAKDYPAKDGWETPTWQLGDLAGKAPNQAVFSGLRPGRYQVAVRAMLGVTSQQMATLIKLYEDCTAAEERVKNADKALTPGAITSAIAVRTSQLATALSAWRNAPPAEAVAKEDAYNALIDSDTDVLEKLAAWKAVNYKDGTEKTAYDDAVKAYFTTKVNTETSTEKSKADAALAIAKPAYETKKATLEDAANNGYAAKPELWGNAATLAVYVSEDSGSWHDPSKNNQINLSDLNYGTPGVVKVTMSEEKPILGYEAQAQLIRDNKTNDLLISGPKMQVLIPKGTLSAGDDLSAMLMQFVVLPEDASGYVVRYIDKAGAVHLVPFCLVTAQKVTYIANAPGSYGLTKNAKSFTDIPANFWGTQYIDFVTQRGLFHGVAKDRFGYADTMTRGMFVTVLGNLSGVDPTQYSEKVFLDVAPESWYGGYVAWASQNNIVGGVGGNRFDPDAPVTREQMCTMLVRYLEWAKITLPAKGTDRTFTDQSEISTWAEQAVALLCSAGIVNGTDLGSFLPGDDATRTEAAAIYARLIEVILGV